MAYIDNKKNMYAMNNDFMWEYGIMQESALEDNAFTSIMQYTAYTKALIANAAIPPP